MLTRRELLAAIPAASMAAAPLPRKKLGRTGIEVTALGYGADYAEDAATIARAADLGVTYFHAQEPPRNAPADPMLGRLRAALAGRRKDVVVGSGTRALTGEKALQDIDHYLAGSGLDYFDVWYMLALKPAQITPDLLAALEEAKRRGKIRAVGLTSHDLPQTEEQLASGKVIDVVLVTYSFVSGPKLALVVQRLAEAGIGFTAMKVMGGSAEYRRVNPAAYAPIEKPGGFAAALRWTLQHPYIASAAVGSAKASEIEANCAAAATPYSGADAKLLGLS